MIPLIPIITRAGAMLLMKQMAKRAAKKKILKDAALKKKVDKIGKKAAKKEAKEKPTKRKTRKKILTDKSVRKRAKKIGQKATKQEATPPFAKSKSSMAESIGGTGNWGYAIRRHKSFNPADTPLKKALEIQKNIGFFKRIIRKYYNPKTNPKRSVQQEKKYQDIIIEAEKKKQPIINKLKKEHRQKKRTRDLKKDSEQRRN